jgi:hypothetical protein
MATLTPDFLYAFRRLKDDPGIAAVAIIALLLAAVGIFGV